MARNLFAVIFALALSFPIAALADVLTFSAGPNGHVSDPTPQVRVAGEHSAPVSAVPNTGFHFFNWTWPGNGVVLGTTDNPLVFTANGMDHGFTANFVPNGQSTIYFGRPADQITALRAGTVHTAARKEPGSAFAWGGENGQDSFGADWGVVGFGVGAYHTIRAYLDSVRMSGKWYNPVSGAQVEATVPGDLRAFAESHGGFKWLGGGYGHSAALTNDGSLYLWGDNTYGQGSVPAAVSSEIVTALAVGDNHNVALTASGKVIAWGKNNYGQLAVDADRAAALGVTVTSADVGGVAVRIMEGLSIASISAIEAKFDHTLALQTGGTVLAWGDNRHGQSTVPAGLSDVTAIAAGGNHSMALKRDQTMVFWGDNSYGQLSPPEGLTGVTAIAAGGYHSMAKVGSGILTLWGRNDMGQCDPNHYFRSSSSSFTGGCSPNPVPYGGSTDCNMTWYYDHQLSDFLVNGVPVPIENGTVRLNNITRNTLITYDFTYVTATPTGASAVKGDRSATVTFSAPTRLGGGPVRGYTVTSNPPGGVDGNAGTMALTHVMTGLTNGVSYTFRVSAYNEYGTSLASLPSNAVVPKGEQSITVTTPAPASAVYGTSFTVAATAPGGPVSYSSAGGCSNIGSTFTMTSGTTPCTVVYDQPGAAAYNPAVQSVNTVLALKADQVLTVSPAAPASAVFNTSFTVGAAGQVGPMSYASSGGCTNSGDVFTMTSGTTACTVTYLAPGDSNYHAASTTSSVTAVKAVQNITVSQAAPASAIFGHNFTVAASAPGGAITFASAGGCSNSGGNFTMTSGTVACTVNLDQAGNGNYLPASQSEMVAAVKAERAIVVNTPPPALASYHTSFTVAASVPGGTVVYSSSGGCSNSGATFTMTSGTTACTVRYDEVGSADYNAASVTSTVTAAKVVQDIVITVAAPASAVFGSSFTVAASAPGGAVTYSSAGGCSNSGPIFTMTSGTVPCTVRYDQSGDEDYLAAVRLSSSTTAVKADQVITVSTPAPASAAYGASFTVAASAPGGTIAYSGTGGCGNVGDTFTMTSGAVPCVVGLSQPGDANYNAAPQRTFSTSAIRAAQTITVTAAAPASAAYGSSFTVAATGNGGPVSYGSAGGCSNSGAMFTMTSGTTPCTVLFTQAGNDNHEAASVSSSTMALRLPQAIAITTPAPASAVYGSTFNVAATAVGGVVSYGSAGGCTNNGTTFTMTSGTTPCTVRYEQAGDGNYSAAPGQSSTTTASKAAQAITITTAAPASAPYGSTFTVAATAPGGEISYGSAGGCSNVGATYTMTSGVTPCTIFFNQAGGANYSAAPQISSITMDGRQGQTITLVTPAPASAPYGASFTVAATAPGGPVSYASSGGCTNNGAVFTMVSGTTPCTVLYNQAGSQEYIPAVQVTSLTAASKASQTIAVDTPAPASAVYGASFTVAGSATGGAVSYSSAGGCSNFGPTFIMTSGTTPCIVSMDQLGGSNYYPAAQQTMVVVAFKAPQSITVSAPPPSSAEYATSFTVSASAPGGPVTYSSSGGCVNNGATFTITSATRECSVRFAQAGNNDYSAAAQLTAPVTTIAALPSAPTIGTVTAVNGQATVRYAAPAFDGGSPVTSYTVTANPGNITATGTGNHLTVTGLTNGTAYTFAVRAVNPAGAGAAATTSSTYTPLPNGDLNGDGVVDLGDALIALRVAVGAQARTAALMAAGDVAPLQSGRPSSNGVIDVGDVVVLLRKSVGLVNW